MIHFLGDLEVKQPKTMAEVTNLISQHENQKLPYLVMSGGTDLVPFLKNYPGRSGALVSLGQVNELKEISRNNSGTVLIGSQVKLAELVKNDLIKEYFMGLSEAASVVASPQI